MSSAEGSQAPQAVRQVVPDSKTPYVLGVLNIIFGSLLAATALFAGGYTIVSALFFAPIFDGLGSKVESAREVERQELEARVSELHRLADEAQDEAKRQELEFEVAELEEELAELRVPNFATMAAKANANRMVTLVVPIIKYGTSLVVNLLLIFSGVGLIRLSESARKLTIGLAWIKILRLVGITILELTISLPWQLELQQEQMKAMAESGPRNAQQQQQQEIMKVMVLAMAVGGAAMMGGIALVAMIYPALLIWFLTRPRVRLAFEVADRHGGYGAWEAGIGGGAAPLRAG